MDRNGEQVLEGAPPPVVASTGQRWSGGVLRVFGVLMFLLGALVASVGLVASMLDVFMGNRPLSSMLLQRLVVMEAGGVLVMVLGSTVGAFGQVMGGTVRMARGSQFVWWLVASAGRDVCVVLGVVLVFSSMFSLIDGFVWQVFLIVLGVGIGFLELAFLAGKWKKRLEVGG